MSEMLSLTTFGSSTLTDDEELIFKSDFKFFLLSNLKLFFDWLFFRCLSLSSINWIKCLDNLYWSWVELVQSLTNYYCLWWKLFGCQSNFSTGWNLGLQWLRWMRQFVQFFFAVQWFIWINRFFHQIWNRFFHFWSINWRLLFSFAWI